MNARVVKRLKAEVVFWAAETRTFIAASRRLIEYFGSKKELASWDAAIEVPLAWVTVVVAQTPTGKHRRKSWPRDASHLVFQCRESTHTSIPPLGQVGGEAWAKFVFSVPQLVPRAEQSLCLVPHGMFCASFAEAGDQPIWRKYRCLVLREWKAVFP